MLDTEIFPAAKLISMLSFFFVVVKQVVELCIQPYMPNSILFCYYFRYNGTICILVCYEKSNQLRNTNIAQNTSTSCSEGHEMGSFFCRCLGKIQSSCGNLMNGRRFLSHLDRFPCDYFHTSIKFTDLCAAVIFKCIK